MDYNALLKLAINAALVAGEEILNIYETNFSVEIKSDNTPVTWADKNSSSSILKTLQSSQLPIISEEEDVMDYEIRKSWEHFWLIDPLDGTKEFVKRNGEFAINIALIENGIPVIGVIYAPVLKQIYFASKQNGSYTFSFDKHVSDLLSVDVFLSAKSLPLQKLPKRYTVIASRSHLSREVNARIETLKNLYGDVDIINCGSSLKQCLVAEGKAHEYPRYGTTMEWDTAAGQCILEQSGSALIDLETNSAMRYNKTSMKNNYFIAKHVR
jgi:3'(2'), 5'-bisphosphate nucleotidase